MAFREMDKELRERLVAQEKDELSRHAKCLRDIPSCPKCGKIMNAKRPNFGVSILATYDWYCKECGVTVTGASDLIVT